MKKLIINADDFALSKGVNYGILECFKNGVLTSTTMMMNAPALDHAVALMKENDLNVGIHLVATMFKPLTNAKSLTTENGLFDKAKMFDKNATINEEELYNEWVAQIELFIKKTGRKPSHIDSHHHIHLEEKCRETTLKLSKKYQLQVRAVDSEFGENILFVDNFYGDNITIDSVKEIIENSGVIEMMSHPAFIDNGLVNATSYSMKRKDELDLLLSNEIKELLNDKKVSLISYNDTKVVV
ncbi:MAG: chitin disaccharide deacetylase [Anaerorhabdus sp.]